MSGGGESERANILLVDDKPERLLSYEAILGSLQQNLVRATSGEEALMRLLDTEFAAVLLDVNMPGMSGFETAELMRGHPVCGKTPIIFVTGVHITDLDRLKGYEMGAADYVYVPVVPEILRGKVQVLVQLHLQRREVAKLNQRLTRTNAELEAAHARLKAEKTEELRRLNRSLELSNAELVAQIAERERAEALLQDAARRKDEFISILAHELRNPLAAMQSGIEILRRPTLSDHKLEWSRNLLGRQVRHLTRLIDDLLDVSRLTNGRVQLRREVLELRQVLSDTLDGVRPLVESKNHRLTIEFPPEPVYVAADAVRLAQVFGNLLANAAKYTAQDGEISLLVEKDADEPDGWIAVRVRDNGFGIPPETLETIFELFTRADAGGSGDHQGLGIGLALVRVLTELHGGTVTAHSDGPGSGSEFVVKLPRAEATVAAPESAGPSNRSPRVPWRMRVLIVDDNVDWACGLAMHLRETSKHDVEVVHTGARGVDAAVATPADAVLLDIGLPDIDGYEVARQLRARLGAETPGMIGISGYGGSAHKARAESAGFVRYLVKPVPYEIVDEALAELAPRTAARTGTSSPRS